MKIEKMFYKGCPGYVATCKIGNGNFEYSYVYEPEIFGHDKHCDDLENMFMIDAEKAFEQKRKKLGIY